MEMHQQENLVLKIHEDVESQPINVQSGGVSEEVQAFWLNATAQKRL